MAEDGKKKSKEEVAAEWKDKQESLKETEFAIDLRKIKDELGIQVKRAGEESRDDVER